MEILSQTTREEKVNNDHLNLLSVFYFVIGGLSLLGAFILLIYIIVIRVIFSNHQIQSSIQSEAPVVETVFGVISIVLIILFFFVLTVGILQILAGFRIRQKRNRTFVLVMGVLALPSFPFGTALGVFTIIVLSRPVVHEMFHKEKEKLDLEKYGKIGE
jgi:hypothetical protein